MKVQKTKTELVNEIKILLERYKKERDGFFQHANHRGKYNKFITDLMYLLIDRD